MLSTIPEIAVALRQLLTHTADDLARFNRFVRRRAKPLTGSLFVQTILLTLLAKPAPALSDYCHTAAARGLRISEQGFDGNFTEQAADLLLGVFKQMATATIGAAPRSPPACWRASAPSWSSTPPVFPYHPVWATNGWAEVMDSHRPMARPRP